MEDYCTYEQCVALKELGFDWRCHYGYNVNKEIEPNVIYNRTEVDSDMLCFDVNGRNIGDISTPTLYQAQKWLFEKCDVWIEINLFGFPNNFGYELKYDYCPTEKHCRQGYNNPKDALSAGIDTVIDYIRNEHF